MNVEVTDACNLNCPFCLRPRGGGSYMDVELFTEIARFLRSHRHRSIGLHWRGEPCVHPLLPELAEAARDLRFKNIYLSTNASTEFLHDRRYVEKLLMNLHRIIICVDGYDASTVGRYRRGADWDTVMRNLETLGDVDTGCVRSLRVLMFRYNDGYEGYYMKLARRYNIQAVNFVSPVIHGDVAEWMSADPRYQRYRRVDGGWRVKRTPACTQNVLNGSSLIVDVDGFLYPCCFDMGLSHPLGHVLRDSWGDIMGNFDALKPRMLKRELEMCRHCVIPSEKIYHWRTP